MHGSIGRVASATLGIALVGFAVHTTFAHAAFAAANGGRPKYEPDAIREANITYGLVFFDDDEGFGLAHDPTILPSHAPQAVRLRGDDHDRLLFDALGHPSSHRYVASPDGGTAPFWQPPTSSTGADSWRFESENEWPVIEQHGGVATAESSKETACASDNRFLLLTPDSAGKMTARIELPIPHDATTASSPDKRTMTVTPRVAKRLGAGKGSIDLVMDLSPDAVAHPLASWTWEDASAYVECPELPAKSIDVAPDVTRAWLLLRAEGGPVALDRVVLRVRAR
jgi:hypothetical protein